MYSELNLSLEHVLEELIKDLPVETPIMRGSTTRFNFTGEEGFIEVTNDLVISILDDCNLSYQIGSQDVLQKSFIDVDVQIGDSLVISSELRVMLIIEEVILVQNVVVQNSIFSKQGIIIVE